MTFFGRKEIKKPILPPLPNSGSLPELPLLPEERQNAEFPPLPQMNQTKEDLDLGIIKGTISPQVRKIGSASEYQPSFKPEERLEPTYEANPLNKSTTNEPIFVKIDKFHEALDNFNKIKEKILGIEKELKNINEIKNKEDEELKEWENEIQSIKARMDAIDNSLFSKIG